MKNPQRKLSVYLIFFLTFACLLLLRQETYQTKANESVQAFDVSIETGQESINAIEGEVVLPDNSAEISLIDLSSSAVSLWIETPKPNQEGKIHFSGAIPGGASGKIKLFTIYIENKSDNYLEGAFFIKNLMALKNDGLGTLVELNEQKFDFSFERKEFQDETQKETILPSDNISPEEFEINIYFDKDIEGGKWVAAFSTQDRQSGVSHYEVWETKNPDTDKENWERANGLYILKDQNRKSYIYIRAIDNQGNIRLEYTLPEKTEQKNRTTTYTLIALIVILTISTIRWAYKRKTQKQNVEESITNSNEQ